MGVKLKWDDQSSQKLDGIEIYRSASKIDTSNPGTLVATVAGTATAYEDNTVANKSIYYYRILAKKGTDKAWSENILAGYFSETGPGNTTPLRGDWLAGLMDIIPAASFITSAALRAKIPALAALSGGTEPTSWYKFTYKGKILFFPDSSLVTASWQQIYNAGLMFGTDDVGKVPAGVTPGTVNQRTVVEINGLRYIVRCPRLSTIPTDQFLTDQSQTLGSEWRDTMARCLLDGTDASEGAKLRLFDLSSVQIYFGPHYSSATVVTRTYNGTQPERLNTTTLTASIATSLVLELIMP